MALKPTPEEIKALADLPHGKAAEQIRKKYDPAWGLTDGTLKKWEVVVVGEATYEMVTTVEVIAKDPEEAKTLAVKEAGALRAHEWERDEMLEGPSGPYEIEEIDYRGTAQ